jgi:Uma2 family endonuclease
MDTTALRRRFTVAEFGRMAETGVARPDERLELIAGEVVEMSPIGERHAACVDFLTQSLGQQAAGRAILRVQGPVALPPDSELYPDVALLAPRDDFYRNRKPTGRDALLVIEVSDTSLLHDIGTKAPIYGRAGVPILWIVDLRGGVVEVFSEPSAGGFDLRRTVRSGDTLTLPSLPGLSVSVDALVA